MADPQEETGGHVAEAPQEQDASSIQKDAVKENGELPASEILAAISGKEKEDPTLSSSEAADVLVAEEGSESAIPREEAKDVKEAGKVEEEEPAEMPPPTKLHAQRSPSSEDGILEGFLSLVGLGRKSDKTEKEQPAEGEAPMSEEPEKELPAEGNSPVDETEVVEPAETEQVEEATAKPENPDAVGKTEAPVEETPKSSDTNEALGVEEETAKPETDEVAERGIPEPVDIAKTDEPETKVGESEASKSIETGDPEPVEDGGEETTPKAEEKTGQPTGTELTEEGTTETDEPSESKVAEEEVPKTLETTAIAEPGVADVADEDIPKTVDPTASDAAELQVAEDQSLKPSEADELTATEDSVNEEKEGPVRSTDTTNEPKAEVESKEEGSSAHAGESTSTVGAEVEEPKKVEGSPEEVQAPTQSPVDQDQPAVEDEEKPKSFFGVVLPKSFFGVVLKPVASNAQSSLEGQPEAEESTSAPASNVQDTNNLDKSLEEAPEEELGAHLPADIAEQETSGDAPPGDVSLEKEAGQTEAEGAPKVESESETLSKEVGPEVLTEVSGGSEPSGNAKTDTREFVQQSNVDNSSEEIGAPSSEFEEKESPPPEISKEISGSAPEETVQDMVEGTAGSAEEPKEIPTAPTPEEKPVDEGDQSRAIPEDASAEPNSTVEAEEAQQDQEIPQVDASKVAPITAAEDTSDRLTGETSKEAKPEEGTALPEKDDADEEKPAQEHESGLEKQPSLSIYIPRQEKATVAEGETPEDNGLTTPRGTPLMQRVEQLEQKLAQLESGEYSTSELLSTGQSTPRSDTDRPSKLSTRYVLEETGSKGTLLDRVAALEQQLAHINLHFPSPNNDIATPQVPTVAEDVGAEPDSKPAENPTREWSPSGGEGYKAPENLNSGEGFKAADDPVKPNTKEKSLPPEKKAVAPTRSNSLQEKKIKAKAAVGKVTGIFTGCFAHKKGGTTA